MGGAVLSGNPDPKPVRRVVATKDEWAEIVDAKQGPCRVCRRTDFNGSVHSRIHFHHLVHRSQGGDDVPENIVPLCGECHMRYHDGRDVFAGMMRLTREERAYVRSKRR